MKKKILSLILTISMICSIIMPIKANELVTEVHETAGITEALDTLKHLANIQKLTGWREVQLDVDFDNAITINDTLIILKGLAGIIDRPILKPEPTEPTTEPTEEEPTDLPTIDILCECGECEICIMFELNSLKKITKTIPEDDMWFNLVVGAAGLYQWNLSIMSPGSLASLEKQWDYEFEVIGQVDETTKYAVIRQYNEDIGYYYSYIFFKQRFVLVEGVQVEEWVTRGRLIRVAKRLTMSDFDNITIGSTLEAVAEVDPIAKKVIPTKEDEEWWLEVAGEPLLENGTSHYTTDGILQITYRRECVNDEFLVADMELISDFSIPLFDWDSKLNEQLPGEITLKINIEDLPLW
jgi:hypothetical protein